MAGTRTSKFKIYKSEVGAEADGWGGRTNEGWDDVDTLLGAKATTGSANAYVLTTGLTTALSAYVTGQSFLIIPNFTNSGAATINVDGLGAKNITKNGTTAVASGDLVSGTIYRIVYDGTQFQVVGVLSGVYMRLDGAETVTGIKTFNADRLNVGGGSVTSRKLNIDGQDPGISITNTGATRTWSVVVGAYTGNDNIFTIRDDTSGAVRLTIDTSGNTRPGNDNGVTFGTASYRWNAIYCTNATIQTSDAREKANFRALLDAEKRAVRRVLGNILAFQWKEAIEKKGVDGARLHIGPLAQDVEAAFVAEGLDPRRYGFFCADPWMEDVEVEEEAEIPVEEEVSVWRPQPVFRDGRWVQEMQQHIETHQAFDEHPLYTPDGEVIKGAVHRTPRMQAITRTQKVSRPKLDESGQPMERLGLRVDQLMWLAMGVMFEKGLQVAPGPAPSDGVHKRESADDAILTPLSESGTSYPGGALIDQRLSEAAGALTSEYQNRVSQLDPKIGDANARIVALFGKADRTEEETAELNRLYADVNGWTALRSRLTDHYVAMQSAMLQPGFDLAAFDAAYGWPS